MWGVFQREFSRPFAQYEMQTSFSFMVGMTLEIYSLMEKNLKCKFPKEYLVKEFYKSYILVY